MLQYGDDFLAFLPGKHACSLRHILAARTRVQSTLAALGLTRNVDKGQWEPTTDIESHLGLTVSTRLGQFLIPQERSTRLRRFAKDLLGELHRERRLLPARKLASFRGLAQSCYLALPCARMF